MAWIKDRPASWDVIRRNFSWEDLRGQLDAAGVDELMLVQACPAPEETQLLLELASRQTSVRGVVGWVSLKSAHSAERGLAMFEGPDANKLVGIRNNHLWAPDGDVIATPQAIEALRLLAERKLPLDLHFPDYTSLHLAAHVIEQVPDNTYVIDHLGKPALADPDAFAPWAAAMAEISLHPKAYVKYSGWATFMGRAQACDVQRYVDFVLEKFGARRVMFGSNWPVALVADSYAQTFTASMDAVAGLSISEKQSLFRETALSCYSLPA
jgi:L-fuconolactonase